MEKIELSVVIPAYNEEKRILKTIKRVDSFLNLYFPSSEIIVVDDGSTDNTVEIISQIKTSVKLKIIRIGKNVGKGNAVKVGVLSSCGEKILFMDADSSADISQIQKLLKYFNDNDIVIASRALKESVVYPKQSAVRRFIGFLARNIISLYVGGFRDTQCGFKLFSRKAAKEIFPFLTSKGFVFDVEILAIARRKGFRIKEVGIAWSDSKGSKVNVFWDPIKFLWGIFRLLFLT